MRSLRTSSLQPIALNGGGLVAGIAAAWVVVTLPRPMGVALGPALVVGLAALLLPAVAPILLVASVPVQEAGAAAMGGVALTATKLALALAVALALVHLVTARRAIHGSWLLVPYLAYLTTMAISLHGARDARAGLAEMYRWGVTLVAFVLVTNFVRSRRAVLGLAGLVALGPLAEVGLGVVQSVQRLGPSSYAVTASLYRAFGTFGMPNTYAGYLEMTGPWLGALAVWALVRTARALRRYRSVRLQGMVASQQARRHLALMAGLTLLFAASALASLLGIALSFSRGAWLGTAAALFAMALAAGRRLAVAGVALTALVALFLAAGGIHYAPAAIQTRYEQLVSQVRWFDSREVVITPDNFAAVERMAHWQAGIAMFRAYPLTGVGIGNYNVRYPEFYVHPGFTVSRGHAHNYYIQAAAETGIIGLAAYVILVLSALATSLRAALRSPTEIGKALGIGAVGVTAAVMVHNVVEDLHVLNLGVQLAAVWALAALATRRGHDWDREGACGQVSAR